MNTFLNDGCEYREQVGLDGDGLTVLAYLSQRYPHSSPQEWAARIQSGLVLVDDLPAQCEDLLRRGCELVWQRPPWIEPDAPRSFSILYEDDDVLAVAKPAGLPTLPGDPGYLLHAAELSFCHPGTGREVVLACEPPPLLHCMAEMR